MAKKPVFPPNSAGLQGIYFSNMNTISKTIMREGKTMCLYIRQKQKPNNDICPAGGLRLRRPPLLYSQRKEPQA